MDELSKLRWQCRRGTLELDVMLVKFLEHGYVSAGVEEKSAFSELLTLEDNRLLPLLMGDVEPSTKIQAELIGNIRRVMLLGQ